MIGAALIRSCISRDVEKVYAVVRPNSLNLCRLPKDKRIEVVECDCGEFLQLSRLINEKCDVFYHIAWNETGPKRDLDIKKQTENILYTIDAVKAAGKLGCTKFIGAGSQAEYGKLEADRISENSLEKPIQPYGIAKYAAGKLAEKEAERLEILCIWVRIFSVYGIYDKKSTMISNAIYNMKQGKKVSFTEGIQLWDYLYEDDAGEAFYLIGKKADKSRVYCLGSGQARPLKEYIMEIRDAINPDLPIGFGEIPYTDNIILNLCADISALQQDTGWNPKVKFFDGIRRIIRFYN